MMQQRKQMVEEVNIFRLKVEVLTMEPFFPAFSVLTTSSPCQQQAPTEHLSSACFSEPLCWPCPGAIWFGHSPQGNSESLSGLGKSINYVVFPHYWHLIPFCGKGRKTCFLSIYSSSSFSQKMRLQLRFLLQYVWNTSPSILWLFCLWPLFSHYTITSSLESRPTRLPMADPPSVDSLVDSQLYLLFSFKICI